MNLRRSPSPFSMALCDSIHHLPKAHWDHVVDPRRVFLRHEYLSAQEASCSDHAQARYALLYQDHRPVAAAAYQIIDLDRSALGPREAASSPPETARASRTRPRLSLRLLLGGNALGSGAYGFTRRPELDGRLAIQGYADATYRIRRAEKLRGPIDVVLLKDFDLSEDPAAQELGAFAYRSFSVDPNMYLPIPTSWTAPQDYFGSLSSKYRSRAKSARKKASGLHCRRYDQSELERHRERLHELYKAVHHRAKFRLGHVGPDYFARLNENLGPAFRLFAYELDGRPIAFRTSVDAGPRMEAHLVGIDYTLNLTFALDQNLLYDYVEEGIKTGARELSLGRTALEMKSALGAIPEPMHCYLRHPHPVGNRVTKPLIARLRADEWVERSPFKEQPLP